MHSANARVHPARAIRACGRTRSGRDMRPVSATENSMGMPEPAGTNHQAHAKGAARYGTAPMEGMDAAMPAAERTAADVKRQPPAIRRQRTAGEKAVWSGAR